MEKNRLEELKKELYSTTFLIGGWKRKKALAQLVAVVDDPDAAAVLTEALQKSSDEVVKARAKEALGRLKDQRTIDLLCASWEKSREDSLSRLIREHGWVATSPPQLRLLTALKAQKLELFEKGSKDQIDQLFKSLSDSDNEIAMQARKTLSSFKHTDTQEIVIQFALSGSHKEALDIVREAGYLPADNGQRSLTYFLTEQWEKLSSHDPEHEYLRPVYEKADKKLKSRIDEIASRNGKQILPKASKPPAKAEEKKAKTPAPQQPPPAQPSKPVLQPQPAVAAAPAMRKERKLLELSDREWEATIKTLEESNQRVDIWQLAHDAPPRWSVQILRLMKQMGWKPRSEEKMQFEEMVKLAAGCDRKDFDSMAECSAVLTGHTDMINCVMAVGSDVVATGSADATLRLWSVSGAKELAKLDGHTGAINCIAYNATERVLISGSSDGTVRLWSVADGEHLVTLKGHSDEVSCLAVSPDGRLLASGSLDNGIRLWVLPEGRELKEMKEHQGSVWSLAFSPDGKMLASGGGLNDHTVKLWSIPDGLHLRTLEGHKGLVRAIIFSKDGKSVISGSGDNTIRIWDTHTGAEQKVLKAHKGLVHSLSLLPGDRLVTASVDNSARVWSISDGKELKKLDRHKGRITGIVVEPMARALASSSWDNTVKIWDLDSGVELRSLEGHTNWVTGLALSHDNQTLISGSRDNTLRLWKLRPILLAGLSASYASADDLKWIHEALKDVHLSESQKRGYRFVEALIRWRAERRGRDLPKVIEIGDLSIVMPD